MIVRQTLTLPKMSGASSILDCPQYRAYSAGIKDRRERKPLTLDKSAQIDATFDRGTTGIFRSLAKHSNCVVEIELLDP